VLPHAPDAWIDEAKTAIRVNDQWRICFTWTKEGPADVEIVDYH
jgi:plasmid maintenance system killer protein